MPWPVGKTAIEILGTPNPRWTQLYGEALDTGKALRLEEPEATLGRVFDLNIFRLDRELNRVAVLFTNVTERKKAEEALRESEAKYRTLFDTIDSGYALTNLVRNDDGRVVDLIGVDFNRNYPRNSGLLRGRLKARGSSFSRTIITSPRTRRRFCSRQERPSSGPMAPGSC